MGAQAHNMYLLLGCLLFTWLSTQVSAKWPLDINYTAEAPAVLVGEPFTMSCSILPGFNQTWRRVNQNKTRFTGDNFTLQSATLNDTGQYQCVYQNISSQLLGQPVTLNVVELLPPVWVSADPVTPTIVEGHEVSLKCSQSDSSIGPLGSWVWKRKGVQDVWKEVGRGRGLTLTRSSQTGTYRCQVNSNTYAIYQEQTSLECSVIIIPLPITISYHVAVAGLSLALLALLLLALLFLRMLRLRTNETATLQDLFRSKETAIPHQTELKKIPNKSPKRSAQKPAVEVGEVYMNCETIGKAYCDLKTDQTIVEEIYDTLD
ncbi:uncharacterized protein LOC124463590 [Hypomesus transpacificus]|uniref:uncharacterized protein LOC124463590 n=1 Tax=Hypomesus transpacificus TaxID=137520 RepID=UPI001F08597B|nr:uncharacterized protein LOC124463590 [Hypomesus transpacificus]